MTNERIEQQVLTEEYMKTILMSKNKKDLKRVFGEEQLNAIKSRVDLFSEYVDKSMIVGCTQDFSDVEVIFSTWGMEAFTGEEIEKYFPKLKYIFFAAGTVQHFAEPFLKKGIRIFSAWRANAIPVSEVTYAEILLASKGFYRAVTTSKYNYFGASKYSDACGGNFQSKIGLIGVGGIGSLVAERLKQNAVEVLYYDPFLSEERAKALNVRSATLEEIFSLCDVISNHLADKVELTNVLNYNLFRRMKPYACFINTGRGRQVEEKGLAKALREGKTRCAVLDVTVHEPLMIGSALIRRKNVFITPHIAGSNGREVRRMAEYMIEEFDRIVSNTTPLYEVTEEMLKTMA